MLTFYYIVNETGRWQVRWLLQHQKCGNENNRVKNNNNALNKIRNYVTLYYTYRLLYCEGYIQITSYYSIINVETKSRVNKTTTIIPWKHLVTILQYITFNNYYIVQHTLRWQVSSTPQM